MRCSWTALIPLVILVACDPSPSSQSNPAELLHALFEDAWAFELQENPLRATSVGVHESNHLLPSVSTVDETRRADVRTGFLERLRTIDRSQLESQDRISYDMFERELSDALSEFVFRSFQIPINADSGFHIAFSRLPSRMPFESTTDYENYIARLRAFPRYVEQQIELMREGLESGMSLPRVVLEGYDVTIESHVVDRPEDSLFYAPLTHFAASIPEAEHERLRESAQEAIMDGAVVGYRAFLEFMRTEYWPGTRESIGASELPNGEAYYAYLVRHFTTLDRSPQDVHETGLAEVARIRTEMVAIIEAVGFEGDFGAFLDFLRTDPRFYAKTPEELLKEAAFIAKKMDAKLPSLFQTLPRLPYGIQPVPDHIAPKYTGGRYIGPSVGSHEPGYYWVNTYKLENRPLYTLESLTLHEAVPGHHLQNALRMELTDLPAFRRFSGIGAFGEGWGLYSERLGLEAGFYEDPYSDFGRLTYEMWRACRLVVDTGIHAMGWSRQQSIDYLASRTALSIHEVTTETDRYIAWPGQALAYKMGELEIRELRARATERLGEKFDLREFHDVVLLNGPVPMPVLEEQVESFIEAKLDGEQL